MARFERTRRRRTVGGFVALVLFPAVACFASCVSLVSLDDRSCPCASGYVCCEATQQCLERGEPCFGEDGGSGGATVVQGGRGGASGSAGAVSGGAAGSQGGTEPQGGTDGSGGASSGASGVSGTSGASGTSGTSGAGEAGAAGAGGAPEPEWRPVGPARLEDPRVQSEHDFEIAPDGTPYLAFATCENCGLPTRFEVPVVERFDGDEWRLLQTDGLPSEVTLAPALALGADGTPYLLTDGRVSVFGGQSWQSAVSSVLPGRTTSEPNFLVHSAGSFWATTFDGARGEITVLRSTGSSWDAVGPGVSGRSEGVRLAFDDGVPHLAHADVDGVGVFVRRFTGSAWEGDELDGNSVDFAVAQDHTFYVAVWTATVDGGIPGTVRVLAGTLGALTEVGTSFGASFAAPAPAVAPDGVLYSIFLSDGYVNVNRFDGQYFAPVGESTPPTGSLPLLRFSASSPVPHIAFAVGEALEVKKYE